MAPLGRGSRGAIGPGPTAPAPRVWVSISQPALVAGGNSCGAADDHPRRWPHGRGVECPGGHVLREAGEGHSWDPRRHRSESPLSPATLALMQLVVSQGSREAAFFPAAAHCREGVGVLEMSVQQRVLMTE